MFYEARIRNLKKTTACGHAGLHDRVRDPAQDRHVPRPPRRAVGEGRRRERGGRLPAERRGGELHGEGVARAVPPKDTSE